MFAKAAISMPTLKALQLKYNHWTVMKQQRNRNWVIAVLPLKVHVTTQVFLTVLVTQWQETSSLSKAVFLLFYLGLGFFVVAVFVVFFLSLPLLFLVFPFFFFCCCCFICVSFFVYLIWFLFSSFFWITSAAETKETRSLSGLSSIALMHMSNWANE